MATEKPQKKTHKEWRKIVKKLRRKRKRQEIAEERNKKLKEEESLRLKDPLYIKWLQDQEELEAINREQEERYRQEKEELWLRRELIAQKQFREQQLKNEATAAAKETERLRIQKEFEELQLKEQIRREERKQREEQAKNEHQQMLKRIADYIETGGNIPIELTGSVSSNPNKQICPFFSKTNACRYGLRCMRNHIRPKLSKILFFPNFFSHIQLEHTDTEHGDGINLECSDMDLNKDYIIFFEDVVEELKKFGKIENFRTCINSQPHLRGNVFVEYFEKRDAIKAYMQLQGRFYASRQINVEFSPIVSWKNAICGLSFKNKCPKGRDCNFLHLFKNPNNVYNVPISKRENITSKIHERSVEEGSTTSWNNVDERANTRNWRWSESPELNLNKSLDKDSTSKKSYSKSRDKSVISISEKDEKNSKTSSHELVNHELKCKSEKRSSSHKRRHSRRRRDSRERAKKRKKTRSPSISRRKNKKSSKKKKNKS